MPNVSTLLSGGVSVGILAGVVSGLFYLVVAGIRWAGEVKLQSGEWFYKQVQRRFSPPAIQHDTHACNNGVGMDPESAQVREFIERLVESLVSGGLDDVCVKRLHSHPEYKPMPEQESPSSAHSALKQLIHTIIHEAMTLPTLQGLNQTPENGVTSEDMTSKTYEDILATAILNKVIQQYQLDGNRNLLASTMEQKPTYISRLEIGVKSPDALENEQLQSLNSSDVIDPMSLTIEECIEEVTTFSNPEEDNEAAGDGEINFLPGLDFVQSRRVPFPELGMDIVEDSTLRDLSDHEEEELEDDTEGRISPQPTDLINPVESWEENWLFQRRRLKNGATPQSMPVPMLVPNPSEDYRALIGDRDAEEISDLSDCSDEVLENLVLAEEESEPDPDPLSVAESEPKEAEEIVSAIKIVIHESEPIQDYESSSEDKDEILEAKNTQLVKSASVDCLSEFGQQESEYTEDYAAATQRQLDSLSGMSDQDVPSSILQPEPSPQQQEEPSPQPVVPSQPETDEESEGEDIAELAVPPRPGTDQSDDEYCTLPATGTIAEREHKKWESAPPLPNNPYSPENISKRLNKRDHFNNRSTSSEASVEFPEFKSDAVERTVIEKPLQIVCASGDLDQKRYGRDYYINSKSPSGDRSPRISIQSPALQVSGGVAVSTLEEQILHRDIYSTTLRARNASSQFKMNPLYEPKEGEEIASDRSTMLFEDPDEEVSLKEQFLHHDMYNATLHARNSSPQFKMNPLYEPKQGEEMAGDRSIVKDPGEKASQKEQTFHNDIDNATLSAHNASPQIKMNPLFESKEGQEIVDDPGEKVNLESNYYHTFQRSRGIKSNPMYKDSETESNRREDFLVSKVKFFKVENFQDYIEETNFQRPRSQIESGYGSSMDSLNDQPMSLPTLRLTPPEKPQMVERTFETLSSMRRSESLRLGERRRRGSNSSFMGGSLRLRKRSDDNIWL